MPVSWYSSGGNPWMRPVYVWQCNWDLVETVRSRYWILGYKIECTVISGVEGCSGGVSLPFDLLGT